MKRHALYFALALAGAAFTLQAAPHRLDLKN